MTLPATLPATLPEAIMAYTNGQTTVGTSPTLIATAQESAEIIVANTGSATVYLGGLTVAASGAAQGLPLAAGATVTVPGSLSLDNTLYGIVATGSTTVNYLAPQSVM